MKELKWILCFSLVISAYHSGLGVNALYSNKFYQYDSKLENNILTDISPEEWLQSVRFGIDIVNRQLRLEQNLLAAKITVENGSISHTQLLDSLPEEELHDDSNVAKKMLKASQYIYNAKCAAKNRQGVQCINALNNKPLPAGSELSNSCINVISARVDGQYPFRRLLPKNYKDGLYEMFNEDKLPDPRILSSQALKSSQQAKPNELLSDKENLALVQWTQFIEHDLSKPVVTSMANGLAIECCSKDNYKLSPRYYHPACKPLVSKEGPDNAYGRKICLNYVRSALSVGSSCNFATVDQVNHATGYLDLSQLYGFTTEDQMKMRSFKGGLLRSRNNSGPIHEDLLPPPANEDLHEFCAIKSDSLNHTNFTCVMAGDSRVNNNPFAVIIYTIFMRNHNQLAQKLQSQHRDWTDERLFSMAKAINIDIYRNIIFNEWLPLVLGKNITKLIQSNDASRNKRSNVIVPDNLQISNEFAVAAMRFYVSMLPNSLKNSKTATTLFVVKDQIYKPELVNKSTNLDVMLESLLHQGAMKVDYSYEPSYVLPENSHPTHVDILAIDIQRGRDHGLQSYVKYLEACENVKINNWQGLLKYIDEKDVNQLKTLYRNWTDIDLIIGGIMENSQNGALLGPTFTCILAEQFDQIKQSQFNDEKPTTEAADAKQFTTMTAFDLLCSNSDLNYVPQNVFQQVSQRNPLVPCTRKFRD